MAIPFRHLFYRSDYIYVQCLLHREEDAGCMMGGEIDEYGCSIDKVEDGTLDEAQNIVESIRFSNYVVHCATVWDESGWYKQCEKVFNKKSHPAVLFRHYFWKPV